MAEQPIDAIELLKADHREAEDLFEQFEKARTAKRKQAIALEVCNALKVHTMLEEEIFYPALRGKIEEDLLDESYVEHDAAKVLINDIVSGDPKAKLYDAKVTVLSEEIKHHVGEEEQWIKGMFAQARRTDVDMLELGAKMQARKDELMPLAKANKLPPAKLAALKVKA